MSREKRTIDDLETAARYLEQSAAQVREAIETLKNADCAEILIHSNAVIGRYLPAIWAWSCHLPFEARVQSEDFKNQRPTQAAIVKARAKPDNERRKKKKEATP